MFESFFDINNYNKVNYRRIGIEITAFSNVLGLIIIQGVIQYASEHNTRSLQTDDPHRRTVNDTVLLHFVVDGDGHKFVNFGDNDDDRSANIASLMGLYNDKDYDVIIFCKIPHDIKIYRSKNFCIKLKNALYVNRRDNHHDYVTSVTIECQSKIVDS